MARRGNPQHLTNAGKGRPKGAKNKVSKNMADTLRSVWNDLQDDPKKSLKAKAFEDSKWFYELCKGMFPKDLFVQVESDLLAGLTIEQLINIAKRGCEESGDSGSEE